MIVMIIHDAAATEVGPHLLWVADKLDVDTCSPKYLHTCSAQVSIVHPLLLSRCVYENLAVEENLLRTHRPEEDGDLLLLWSNRPAVVIGRHQNPWLEVNLPLLEERNIDLARRHSGGGTVYHDEGNLNISLLTTQKDHCRKRNLEWIANVLNKRYTVKVVPTSRDDLEMEPGRRKCSGTAARIARGRAYHHMTMLVDVHLATLSTILRSPMESAITSTSTRSVRAPAVGYLKQDDTEATVDGLSRALQEAFAQSFQTCSTSSIDAGMEVKRSEGTAKAYDELRSWEWIFGRTPKFHVTPTGVQSGSEGEMVVSGGCVLEGGRPEWKGRPLSSDMFPRK